MLKATRTRRQKSIVSITSMMGRASGRGYLAYGTAKAALAHWARLAASDLAPRIRVNGIYVGSVMTSALEFVAGAAGDWKQMEDQDPAGPDRRGRGHRGRGALPRLAGRAVRHRQDARGRRRHPGTRTSTSTCPTSSRGPGPPE